MAKAANRNRTGPGVRVRSWEETGWDDLIRSVVAAGVVCLSLGVVPMASAADRVYWANFGSTPTDGRISFANLDGSGGADLTTIGATVNSPFGVAIDAAAGRIYWANAAVNTISYAQLDGSGGHDLPTGSATVNHPQGVAVDPAAGRIYWANFNAAMGATRKISFAKLDGSGGGDLATGSATVNQPSGVAVDPGAGRVYWTNNSGSKAIAFASLDGTGGGDLPTGSATVAAPDGLAIDPVAKRVYWANNVPAGPISYAKLDGSGGGDLATVGATVNSPLGVAVDPKAGLIYWSNANNKLSFAKLDGTGGGDLPTGAATVNNPTNPVLLHAPGAAGTPAVSGTAVVGATLSCSQGTWAPDLLSSFDYLAPQSFAYAWSRDGAPIDGATSSSTTATAPGAYRCQVTAKNQAGSTPQTSGAFTVSAPPPLPGPPAPPAPAPPHLASITGLRVSPNSFRAAPRGASIAVKRRTGATVSYADSEAATTTLTVLRPARGWALRGRCLTRRPRGKKGLRRCTTFLTHGSFVHTDRAGANRWHFTGRVGGRKLRPGRYRLRAVPGFAGKRGPTRTTQFRIRR